jgi:hypothetical protein
MRIKKILYERRLRPGAEPQGLARNVRGLRDSQRVVCLTEVPPHLANRLVTGRSHHGIGFRRNWLIERAGVPTWTLDQGTAQSRLFKQWIKEAKEGGVDPDDRSGRSRRTLTNPGFSAAADAWTGSTSVSGAWWAN